MRRRPPRTPFRISQKAPGGFFGIFNILSCYLWGPFLRKGARYSTSNYCVRAVFRLILLNARLSSSIGRGPLVEKRKKCEKNSEVGG